MHPADIQAAMKKRELTQKAIADRIGVTQNHVSRVINKQVVSDKVMKAVAEAIGKHPAEVFPEFYGRPPKRSTSKRATVG